MGRWDAVLLGRRAGYMPHCHVPCHDAINLEKEEGRKRKMLASSKTRKSYRPVFSCHELLLRFKPRLNFSLARPPAVAAALARPKGQALELQLLKR